MNISSKRLISLILAVIMSLTMAFSLSSCTFEFSLEDFFQSDNNENDNGESGNNNVQLPNNTNPNFYPGSGMGSLENVSVENRTLLSTVSILSNFTSGPSAGSGVIFNIDKTAGNAYIVTNYHVLYYDGMASSIEVYLYGMENKQYAIPATFVGGSLTNDIAVIKVSGSSVLKNSYAIAATFADSENVRIFDTATAVGNPEGYGLSATKGIINIESEEVDIEGVDGSIITLRVMRTDAAVNPGNSGGGLYNENGEIIGIICAKLTGDDVDCIGYAIPSNLAKNLINNILDNCNGTTSTKIRRPLIGISVTAASQGIVVNPETGEISQKHLVSISNITPACIIKDRIAEGDIISSITIDGVTTNINRTYQVPDTMLNARLGSTVTLHLTRGGNNLSVSFTVSAEMIKQID